MRKDVLLAIIELTRRDKIRRYRLMMPYIMREGPLPGQQAYEERPKETTGWLVLLRKLWESRFRQLDQVLQQIKSK